MKRLVNDYQKYQDTRRGVAEHLSPVKQRGSCQTMGRERTLIKQIPCSLALILFFAAQMTMQTYAATTGAWSFDEIRDWGEPPAGWEDGSSAGSEHTYRNTTFDGKSCLHTKTTGGTSDRVKVRTTDVFREGTYDWVVYVPAIDEPGAKSSIGAFLYSPESTGDLDAREIDFEIGYGSASTRANLSIPDDKLVCYMTVQRDDSSGTSFSSTIIPIEPASWYTLRITLTPDDDGDYIARWFIKKGEGEFVESRSPKKCHYGKSDTTFKVYASLETLNFIGDFQPTTDKHAYFDSISVSSDSPVEEVVEYDTVFEDNFDNDTPVDSANAVGYNVYGNGTLDKGVTSLFSTSPDNSAYVVVDLDPALDFRSIFLHDIVPAIDLTDGILSVQLSADVDLSAGAGIAGFHLYDADGSEYGTVTGDRFAPSSSFGLFSQDVSSLTQVIVNGEVPGLDTTNIVRYAIDFFDPNGTHQSVTFYIDDFKGEAGEIVIPPFAGDVNLSMSITDTNAVELSWYAGLGSSYQLQYALDLASPTWVDFGSADVGNDSTNNMVDLATNSARMYRVKIIE